MKDNLIVGQKYDLKYAGTFCHLVTLEGYKSMKKGDTLLGYTFVGKIESAAGTRHNGVEYLLTKIKH